MKTMIATLALMFSASAFASGSFECKTLDSSVMISGGQSSAGTWVQSVTIDGLSLQRGTDFTADQLYVGSSVFHFTIMDGNYNLTLMQVETVKKNDLSAGIATIPSTKEDGIAAEKVIVCEFLY